MCVGVGKKICARALQCRPKKNKSTCFLPRTLRTPGALISFKMHHCSLLFDGPIVVVIIFTFSFHHFTTTKVKGWGRGEPSSASNQDHWITQEKSLGCFSLISLFWFYGTFVFPRTFHDELQPEQQDTGKDVHLEGNYFKQFNSFLSI